MLIIRYFRAGKKNQPHFKIVVTDKRNPTRGGLFVDEVGFVDPVKKVKNLNVDKIKEWIKKGAQLSDSIHNLLITEKIIEGKKIDVHNKKKVAEGAAPAAAPSSVKGTDGKPAAEAPKAEEPKKDVSSEASAKEEVKPAA